MSDGQLRRTATVTVLFSDLVGSTERQSRSGDEAADEFRFRFFGALEEAVRVAGGETVKNTGDGLMVVFRTSAVDAVRCASMMHEAVAELDRDDPAFVRVGVSAGEVAEEAGDWFGTPVVESARLCARAAPGQTLVSAVVLGLVGSRGGHQFRSVGRLQLKGLPSAMEVAEVVRRGAVARQTGAPKQRRRNVRPSIVGAVTVLAIALAFVGWQLSSSSGSSSTVHLAAARGYTPRFTPTRCPDVFAKKVPGGTCGHLVVPADRNRPTGPRMRLLVTRAPARGHRAADPVIEINSRVDGTEDVANSPARDHADLLTIETRQFEGPDHALACPELAPSGRQLLAVNEHDLAVIAEAQRALRACYRRLRESGVPLDRFTLSDSAADVVDLARAEHFSSVNLVAASTNAIAAYGVVRTTPPGFVRSMTLESPVAPNTSPSTDPTGELANAFDHYLALCAKDPVCNRAYPDLRAQTVAAWERAQSDPIVSTLPLPDGSTLTVSVDGDRTAKAIANTVGVAENGLIGVGITQGASTPQARDTIARVAGLWDVMFVIPDYPWTRTLGSWCSYDLQTLSGAAAVSSLRPELAGIDDGVVQWLCAAWPVKHISQSAFASVAGPVPTLIVDGQLNPTASPQWTATLATGLTHATVLDFPTLGNLLLARGVPPCLNQLRREFLRDPSRSFTSEASRCERQSPRIDFATVGP